MTAVCEGKLQGDPGQNQNCLKVTGDLASLLFDGVQEYCAIASKQPHNNS